MLLSLITLLLPVAATCGWYIGRRNSRQQPGQMTPKLHRDYFKGLNYLINEQPDKAVDVFIRLLEVDSDTVETHLALGSLFRRRGEVERAIRVHQNLIARPQLANQHRVQALSELGQDYLRAGVLDRAERLFLELVDLGAESQTSLQFLLYIYQQEKDWHKAIEVAQKLETHGYPMHTTIAQFNCELAEQAIEKGRISAALHFLKRAQAIDHGCVRASLIRGKLAQDLSHYKDALRHYKRAIEQDADYMSEAVGPLVECYRKLDDEEKMVNYFKACLSKQNSISLVLAISDYLRKRDSDKAAIEFLARQIRKRPSLSGLNHLVNLYLVTLTGDARDKLQILHDFIEKLLEALPSYRCLNCGFSGNTLYWVCPSCHHWNKTKPIQGIEGS